MTVVTDAGGTTLFSGGDALTEGTFAVSATDVRNGFTGRATGKVTRDGEQVTVNVYLYDQWGIVSGHVARADGFTPVANAEIAIGRKMAVLNATAQRTRSVRTAKMSPTAVTIAGTTATQMALFLIAVVNVDVVKSVL